MKKLLIFILVLAGIFYHPKSKKAEEEKIKTITVTVEGAVEVEGDYSLMDTTIDSLMNQITLKSNAAVYCINYDRTLLDGDRLYIPYDNSNLISLNSATKEELMTINGIGEKKAQSIIDARPFTAIEDLMNVSGIGEKTYLKWREYLCI